ncbi:MAG: alkyl sulfatase C-terminal domain-containing protein, partial [Paracoccaceae bacterium]
EWGMVWARHMILDKDFDAEFLMFYLERSVDPTKLIGSETVIKFRFADLTEQRDWWLLVDSSKAQVCLKDPGKDINVYFNCTVRTMHDVWMGDRTYRDAISSGDLKVEGDVALTRNIQSWLRPSVFAASPRVPVPA